MRRGLSRLFRPPTTESTRRHYAELMRDEVRKHHPWGKAARFSAEKAVRSPSVRKYFAGKVAPFIRSTDRVLDLGCGSGIFLPSLSELCGTLVAVDVSWPFVRASDTVTAQFDLRNTTVVQGQAECLPFGDASFDVVVVIDTLHHLYRLDECVRDLQRVLRPGGRLLMFEPNIMNPALLLMCVLDRNEWGALGLCRKTAYVDLFESRFHIDTVEYNGLLIGPDGPLFRGIADLLNSTRAQALLGWLNPKLFIALTNA